MNSEQLPIVIFIAILVLTVIAILVLVVGAGYYLSLWRKAQRSKETKSKLDSGDVLSEAASFRSNPHLSESQICERERLWRLLMIRLQTQRR